MPSYLLLITLVVSVVVIYGSHYAPGFVKPLFDTGLSLETIQPETPIEANPNMNLKLSCDPRLWNYRFENTREDNSEAQMATEDSLALQTILPQRALTTPEPNQPTTYENQRSNLRSLKLDAHWPKPPNKLEVQLVRDQSQVGMPPQIGIRKRAIRLPSRYLGVPSFHRHLARTCKECLAHFKAYTWTLNG